MAMLSSLFNISITQYIAEILWYDMVFDMVSDFNHRYVTRKRDFNYKYWLVAVCLLQAVKSTGKSSDKQSIKLISH